MHNSERTLAYLLLNYSSIFFSISYSKLVAGMKPQVLPFLYFLLWPRPLFHIKYRLNAWSYIAFLPPARRFFCRRIWRSFFFLFRSKWYVSWPWIYSQQESIDGLLVCVWYGSEEWCLWLIWKDRQPLYTCSSKHQWCPVFLERRTSV